MRGFGSHRSASRAISTMVMASFGLRRLSVHRQHSPCRPVSSHSDPANLAPGAGQGNKRQNRLPIKPVAPEGLFRLDQAVEAGAR